jgi:hypothetical protein
VSSLDALPGPAGAFASGDGTELITRAETIDAVYGRDIVPDGLRSGDRAPA